MDVINAIKSRRSIRKYQTKQVPRDVLESILETAQYAPNAGGGQRTIMVAVQNAELTEKLGKMNIARLNRASFTGGHVSSTQPSIIDDPTMKSGFYGAPCVCVIFGAKNFLYSIPDAFCCAESVTLAAHEYGVSSCIIARAQETFDTEYGKHLLQKWQIPDNMVARCFVLLGYCNGEYPSPSPRKQGRIKIVTDDEV